MEKISQDPFLSHFDSQLKDSSAKWSKRSVEKIHAILKQFTSNKISKNTIESLCFTGVPDDINGLRALSWKILLGYLPESPAKWKSTLDQHRSDYQNHLQDLFIPRLKVWMEQAKAKEAEKAKKKMQLMKAKLKEQNPDSNGEESKEEPSDQTNPTGNNNGNNNKQGAKKPNNKIKLEFESDADHPLSKKENSTYNQLFKDQDLWEDIEKDTKRTRSEMDFFQKETKFPLRYANESDRPENKDKNESHNEVLSRILFVYGKLHPQIRYVQGMNEIIAPIYYCFCNDKNPLFVGHAEADAFFCFSHLMGDIQDGFAKDLDNTNVGIQSRVKILNDLMKKVDKPLWQHLEKQRVNPQFYSLRWLMLLLTQEFEMIDVFRLWDTLLSHPKKLTYLNYICLAMIVNVREDLIREHDFAPLMEILQKKTNENLEEALATAIRLYKHNQKPGDMEFHLFF